MRPLLAFGLLFGGLATGRIARAHPSALEHPPDRVLYTEAHHTGDDVRIRIDIQGRAHIEHTLSLHVLAGQKRTFEIVGVEPGALPDPQATVLVEGGGEDSALPAQVSLKSGTGPPTFEATMDDPKALRRGKYRIRIAYDVDLVAAREIVRDGAMWRIAWIAPVAVEGFDAARVVFEIPGAETAPRAVRLGSDAPDDAILSSVHREGAQDEIELIRPRVARGEAVTWSLLASPQAFAGLRMDPVAPASVAPPRRGPAPTLLVLLALVAAGYGALVRKKEALFAAACRAAGVLPRPLVRMPPWLRALAAGGLIAAGVAMQVTGSFEAGSLVVALAMLCAVFASAPAKEIVRGPGQWLVVRPEEAFASSGETLDVLDLGAGRGKVAFVLALAGVVGAGWLLQGLWPLSLYLAALDSLALLPLFATGRRVQLAPDVPFVARRLRPLFRRLTKNRALRVAPWARVPSGARDPDELRLLVVPRLAMPGVVGIEVGLASRPSARASGGYATFPEVLVRVHEASAASARMTTLIPRVMPLPGRRPEERVYSVTARYPTLGWTRALVERLSRELYDRRKGVLDWAAAERRVPPRDRASVAPGVSGRPETVSGPATDPALP